MSSRYLQAISASFGLFSLGAAMAASGVAPITISAAAPSTRVSYGDLDLDTADGVRTLEARVRGAAEAMCTMGGMEPFWQMRAERDCMRAAIAGASADMDLAVARSDRRRDARAEYIEIASRR